MSHPDRVSARTHLLLVDDDRLILATLAQGLSHAGYLVSTAESQEDAEVFLQRGERPDLVILDVQMPQSDGLALASRLREVDHVPFIMLSAYSDAPTVDRAAAAGALGYLVKPIDTHKMIPAIEAALVRASELRALKASTDQLQLALAAERDVNVAVGITMVQYRLSRAAAFDMLRNVSRTQRRKLSQVAADVVQGAEALHCA